MSALGRPRALRYNAVILAAVVGTLATIAAFLWVCSWEYQVATIDFQSRARSYLEFMNADLGEASAVMRSVSAFIGSSDHPLAADEFARFCAASRERVSALRDTAWAPRVTLAERPAFERAARAAGLAGYHIKQFSKLGRLTRALPRAEYYALLYNAPDRLLERPLIGLDLVFEKQRATAARRALLTDRPAATPPMDVLTVKQRGGGILSYMPVYRRLNAHPAGGRDPRGLVLGVFDIPVFVASILGKHSTLNALDLYLFNPNAQGERRVLYRTTSAARSASPPSEQALLAGPHLLSSVVVIDRRLGAIVSPREPVRLLRWSLFGVTTLIAGFTMTAMIVAYLLVSIRRTIHLVTLTLELQARSEQITAMSRHDALTGLPNRVMFGEQMQHALARFGRGAPFALLFLDLDRFKAVNDSLGHGAGDQLLCSVARRIQDGIRDTDMAARLGGDEFAVLLADVADQSTISAIANRLIRSISEPYTIGDESVTIGVSIGVSIAAHGVSAEDIIAQADMAMYEAKASGRGTLRIFERNLRFRVDEKSSIESDLRGALDRGELDVHYQPLVNIADGRVVAFEALVRWKHPERGMIAPDRFIPIAEECGLIARLGAWVLRRACEDAVGWPQPVNVAVNISPLQLKGNTLLGEVVDALDRSGLPPSRLEVELTEAAVLEDSTTTLATLSALRELGIAVAFDDFGAGYSSLSSLLRFPFDKIKIDRSFVENSATCANSAAIVRAVVGLGASLGLTTTGEGVETMAQLERLRGIGCTEAQGYLFSPARPNVDVPRMLHALHERSSIEALPSIQSI